MPFGTVMPPGNVAFGAVCGVAGSSKSPSSGSDTFVASNEPVLPPYFTITPVSLSAHTLKPAPVSVPVTHFASRPAMVSSVTSVNGESPVAFVTAVAATLNSAV